MPLRAYIEVLFITEHEVGRKTSLVLASLELGFYNDLLSFANRSQPLNCLESHPSLIYDFGAKNHFEWISDLEG